jgi:hypothetical protein
VNQSSKLKEQHIQIHQQIKSLMSVTNPEDMCTQLFLDSEPQNLEFCEAESLIAKIACQSLPSPCKVKISYDNDTQETDVLNIYCSTETRNPAFHKCSAKKVGHRPQEIIINTSGKNFTFTE